MEPERLHDSIPRFKPWISGTAWGHWEEFLQSSLIKLSCVPDSESSYCWPVSVLQASSERRTQFTTVEEGSHGDDGQVLEEMLDEERVAVEVKYVAIVM